MREHYDEGGHSGGSMDRPALQKLLADVRAGRIDVIGIDTQTCFTGHY
jgi:site-specific DNA recombinase